MDYERTETLIASQFNPPARIEKGQLSSLVDSIRQDGFWDWEPIVLGRDGRVADGHRRLAAAKLAGIEKVPVKRVDMETSELWVRLNGLRKAITGRDYAYAYTHGIKSGSLDLLDIHPIRDIRRLVEIGGDELVQKIVTTKSSPGILREAQVIAKYCGEKGNDAFLLRAVNWLLDHKAQNVTRFFIRSELEALFLHRAVMEDKPITLSATLE